MKQNPNVARSLAAIIAFALILLLWVVNHAKGEGISISGRGVSTTSSTINNNSLTQALSSTPYIELQLSDDLHTIDVDFNLLDIVTTNDLAGYARTNALLSGFINDPGFITECNVESELCPAQGAQINSGGAIAWESNLVFSVGPAEYCIQGSSYSSTGGVVTLAAADGTHPRIDVIGYNTLGAVMTVTGTPSATPVAPDVNELSQVGAGTVTIAAGATEPTLVTTNIYLEGTEWTPTGTGTNFVLQSTVAPFAGLTNVAGYNMNATNFVRFTSPGATTNNLASFSTLTMKIKSQGAWGGGITNRIRFSWWLGTTRVSQYELIYEGQYGFASANTSDYQTVNIPVSAFNASNPNVTSLLLDVPNGASGMGFYLDNIKLQSVAAIPDPTLVQWLTFTADTGVTTANTPTDTFKISGGTNTSTRISGDTVFLDATVPATISTTTTVNWAQSYTFEARFSTATTLVFTNAQDGKAVNIALISTGTNAVTWPATVRWSTLDSAVSSITNKTDVVTVLMIGTNQYATPVRGF